MRWDSSRPVPWQRLVRDWVVYALIASVVFLVFFRGDNAIGAVAGVLISGPLYVALGAVMAKFGYTRKRFSELREESRARADATASSTDPHRSSGDAPSRRARPAPTRRTGGGGNTPRSSSKRKR